MARQNGFGRRTCEVAVINPTQYTSSSAPSSRKPHRPRPRGKSTTFEGLGHNNALVSRIKPSSLLLRQPHFRSTSSSRSRSKSKSDTARKPSLKKRRAAWSLLERCHPISVRDKELAKLRQLQQRNKMSTNSQSSVPEGRSSSRERGQPLTAAPDPVKGVWPAASTSSDRSKSVTSEEESLFSASSRPTNETTPEYSDRESKASAVHRWATSQPPRTIAVDELASRLSAAAASQQNHTSTSTAPAGGNPDVVPPTDTTPPLMTSAIPVKAVSPSAPAKAFTQIPVANLPASPKEEIPHKTIIKLKRCVVPEPQDKPVKKYTSKKGSRGNDTTHSDLYAYPEDSGSETCPTNRIKPTKKTEQRRTKKPKPVLSSATSASSVTVDDDSGSELAKQQKHTKDQQRRAHKLKSALSPATSASSTTVDNDSDSDYVQPTKTKKRKSPLPEDGQQPAAKKTKTKTKLSLPSPAASSPSTEKSTTPAAAAAAASDRPKQHYELRAAEILRRPLDYDDCVRDDTRPGKAQRIRRVFRQFRRDQGEPISTKISGARNPPSPSSAAAAGGEKWGKPYQRGGDGGVVVGWTKTKARRFWGNEANKSASEYAKKQ